MKANKFLIIIVFFVLAGCKPILYEAPTEITTQIPTETITSTPMTETTQPLIPLFPTSTPYLPPPPEPYEACPSDLPSKLQVGMPAMVGLDSASVRMEPGNNQPVIAGLTAGTLINITGGPECFEGQTWWQITTSSMPGSGWVFESDLGRPYISPVQSTGSISGTIEYPGGTPPAMRVVALHLSGDIKDGYIGFDGGFFYTDTGAGDTKFVIRDLPNSFYWVIAYPVDGSIPEAGGYTQRAVCINQGQDCPEHTLVPIPLSMGQQVIDIRISDWTGRGVFPVFNWSQFE